MTQPHLMVSSPETFEAYRISPDDTVRLALVASPSDGVAVTVVYEIWDPGGAQPPNSHADATESFFFLAGEGVAHSDDEQLPVSAGDFLVLPPGSVHRIVNTGPGRLYAITTMMPDEGFADLIRSGTKVELDAEDYAVFGRSAP